MGTDYTFKPIMTSYIRLLMKEHIEMANILAKKGFSYDAQNEWAEKIITEIDRQEELKAKSE